MAIRRNIKSGVAISNKRELPGLFHKDGRNVRRYRLIGTKEPECNRAICYGYIACPGLDNTCALIVGCD